MKEKWVQVKDNPKYEVSNFGRVRSLYFWNINTKKYELRKKPLILKTQTYKGYEKIRISKNSKKQIKYIHRLVSEAFIPNPNNYKEVNHIDNNSLNNNVNNLEWCNRKYNIEYMIKHQEEILNRNEMRLETLEDIYYGIENNLYKNMDEIKKRIDVDLLEKY